MIPLSIPNLCGNEAKYLAECIESTFVSTVGPFVTQFEGMVAEAAGTRFAVATSAGTTGLHLALMAVGIGRDDLVILPSFTFIASANAISHCGASPWLFDISPSDWCLDPELLARTLAAETEDGPRGLIHKASGRRVAAIMPVHTLGQTGDMDAIVAVARRHGLKVVADSAAALGATYHDRKVGTLADLSVFSFNGNKTITTGGGGAVAGDDEALMTLVRHISGTARVGSDYTHDRVGYNYRMTNVQAALGCAQMENLDAFVAAKRRIRATYNAAFADLSGVLPFPVVTQAESAAWLSGVVVPRPSDSERLRARLRQADIDARPFWKPMHLQPPYAEVPRTDQPEVERLWQRIVTLPCSTQLTDAEQAKVIAIVRESLA